MLPSRSQRASHAATTCSARRGGWIVATKWIDATGTRRRSINGSRGPRIGLCLVCAILLGALGPVATTSQASPAPQDAPSSIVYLPLALHGTAASELVPPAPAPSATPDTTALPPTTLPTATATPAPSATAEPLPAIELDGDWVRTPHYALLSPSAAVDKRDLGHMMEQFYAQASAYFGAEPAGADRLVGKVFADSASYRAGLAADGITDDLGSSGGYYSPHTKAFYLFVQPSRHYTRMLTMHEAGHRLQNLAGGCSYPGWWTEGEAEHLGMHTWDGRTLHMARQPLISLEDHPKSALDAFRDKGGDVGPIVRGDGGWSYREAWAVVSFLRAAHPAQFDGLRARYCAGEPSAEAWQAVFGAPVSAAMNAAYEAWLVANQQPWRWVWNAFEPWGDRGLHGQADSNALAILKERPAKLEVAIEPISEAMAAGIVVAYYGTEDFVMLRLFADRSLQVIRVTEGFRWQWLKSGSAPEPADGALDRMSATVEGDRLILAMNGEAFFVLDDPRDLAGTFGVNLEGCELRLTVLP